MKHAKQQCMRGAALGLLAVGALCAAGQAYAQAAYPSAEAAAEALATSISTGDEEQLKYVLGADFQRYVPQDSVSRDDVYAFLAAWSKHHEVVAAGPASAAFIVGQHGWSFPAPILKGARGWHFDVREGAREMQRRRIDRNEDAAIATLQALCEAQQRYRSSVGQGRPAQRIVSREGQHDGLYWQSDGQSPAQSPLNDDALVMGANVPVDAALHGYRYAILPASDETGCAFAAWPAVYGRSGQYSFVIGPGGKVAESDLGRQSTVADFDQRGRANEKWGDALS
ncbi:DUF2950 family protein [Bordetella sp. BOR01]|uniref:DUF2950 family protein n=1 Tax=Bordetella sp. BOR01 TaxID=2854779 RepID=UPI001C49025C|nr:DUF2950 family protein [Bordetella sp. BOR01]MBV7482428.1 DUF2950 domain-containing protein [Bordetella sp. BOR01]